MQRKDTASDGQFRARLVEIIPQIRAVALVLTADEESANALTRAMALRALGESASCPPPAHFKAWCLQLLHETHRARPQSRSTARIAAPAPEGDGDHSEEFRSAFWRLSPSDREMLILMRDRELTPEDIAQIRGCGIAQVKRLATHARNALKSKLTGLADGDSQPRPGAGREAATER
jgi:RNA polymerase sigma-70 factor (ECF subfamily)